MVEVDMKIDILMIGVIRPKMIEETTISLFENVLNDNHEYRMIANIDPIGEKNHSQMDCIKVLKKYFPNIIYNCSSRPSVINAWKWVLSKAETKYFWFKEDDIKILRKVDLDDMIRILDDNSKLSMLMMDKHGTLKGHQRTLSDTKILRSTMEFEYTGDRWYKAPHWFRASGITSTFVKKDFLLPCVKHFVTGNSPNNTIKGKQVIRKGQKNMEIAPFLRQWDYGYYQTPNSDKHFIDLGKEWRTILGYEKPRGGVDQTWIKTK
jgi:hypothetical protein